MLIGAFAVKIALEQRRGGHVRDLIRHCLVWLGRFGRNAFLEVPRNVVPRFVQAIDLGQMTFSEFSSLEFQATKQAVAP